MSTERSNYLIIRGERVPLPQAVLEAGGTAVNWLDDREPHLAAAHRTKPLTTFVLHETGGNSATGCKDTLLRKKLGVHLILGKDGTISNHADLADEVCWHAGQANKISVGIEVVNPYRPELARDPHGIIVAAPWWCWVPRGAKRLYVTPLPVQIAVVVTLVPWLCDHLGIPVAYPTRDLGKGKPQITGWRKPPLGWRAKPGPGIVAHSDFGSHGDGRYLLEQLMEVAP